MGNFQKSHIVLGLGVTGLSVVRYLCSQGITPLVMDSRHQPPGASELAAQFPQVDLVTGNFDCRLLVQATQIIVSPGIAVDIPEIRAASDMGIEVIGDVELFARAVKDSTAAVIGITGSNGKSTVTTIVAEMAKAAGINYAVGGNIGVPALDLLQNDIELYVLELSSFQLETTFSLNCISATCLNISEDHMDRYRDLEEYRQAKLSLYCQSKHAVYNRDDELTSPNEPMNQNSFGLNAPEDDEWGVCDGTLVHGRTEILSQSEVALVGSHNTANLLAAMALAYQAGISKAAMVEVARNFNGLEHRCELVANVNGIAYVNDSKATNVGATVAALDGLSEYQGKIVLIAGGDSKGADFRPLTPVLKRVSQLITLGKDGDKIADLVDSAIKVKTMADAVERATAIAGNGDIVLMSPACASLDMYRNFMERGNDFRRQVEAISVETIDA